MVGDGEIRKSVMVGDGEILSKLFQYISHQLISVIQNIILRK